MIKQTPKGYTPTLHPSKSLNDLSESASLPKRNLKNSLISIDSRIGALIYLCTLSFWSEKQNGSTDLLKELKDKGFAEENESLKRFCFHQISRLKESDLCSSTSKIIQCFWKYMNGEEIQTIRSLSKELVYFLDRRPELLTLFFPKTPSPFIELQETLNECKPQKSPGIALQESPFFLRSNLNRVSSPKEKPPLFPFFREGGDSSKKTLSSFALEELKQSFSSYFLFEDSIESDQRRIRKTKELILKIPSDFAAKQIFTFFLYHIPRTNRAALELDRETLEEKVQSLISKQPWNGSLEEFESSFSRFSSEEIRKAAESFIQHFTTLDAAKLKVCLDFMFLTHFLSPMNSPLLNSIFEEYEPEETLWIERHQDELARQETLHLSGTGIQTISIKLLEYMPNMKEVYFARNYDSQPSLTLFRQLLKLPELEVLDLSDNAISYFPTDLLELSHSLKRLVFSGNSLPSQTQGNLIDYCQKANIDLALS